DGWQKRGVVYTLERMAATCSDAELVQNPEDLVTLRRVLREPTSKLVLLGNGVDLSRFGPSSEDEDRSAVRSRIRSELGIDDDTVLVGAVGRLVLEKGYAELFDAWERIRPTLGAAVLAVVGPVD